MSAAPAAEARCFHCELPIPRGVDLFVESKGNRHGVCCHGCEAVARMILDHDLGEYYRRREVPADTPDGIEFEAADAAWDDAALQRDFVHKSDGRSEASLSIRGMHCAACAWLIERRLEALPGVELARVGLSTHRVRVVWREEEVKLSRVFAAIREIGYGAEPHLPDRHEALMRSERRAALRRIGVSGLGTMQVMMFAVGLYAGAGSEGTPAYREFLRWVSWLVASGVVVYAAAPFFVGAWRDIRRRAPGMDVPVALAIGGAYSASTWATVTGTGEVYFDSVCMFTFFLGVARFLESSARRRSDERVRALMRRLPETALLQSADGTLRVPVRQLAPGQLVLVQPGETFPVDGSVAQGEGAANEALLTGEAAPCAKRVGDRVLAGSQNIDTPLLCLVERIGSDTTAAAFTRLLDRAQDERPDSVRLADVVARYFVSFVIVLAAGVGAVWWSISPADAPWVVLSVLVVTCPCALSLATPTALAASNNALAARGFLVTRGHVLETLPRVSHVVFDKTGTLTRSGLQLCAVVPLDGRVEEIAALALARLLEGDSAHPIARAFRAEQGERERAVAAEVARRRPSVDERQIVAGRGVEGVVSGRRLRLGRPDWVIEGLSRGETDGPLVPPSGRNAWLLLADDTGPLAWFGIAGELRADAPGLVRWLRSEGIGVSLLSGDPSHDAVRSVASQLGITAYESGATPEQKLRYVEQLEARGEVVAAVGDGVNDAPHLGRAAVSIAMGGGTDLARVAADAVLLGDRLAVLEEAWRQARRTRTVVRQNLVWAAGYNAAVLPLAATGQVPPWLAAVGMSLSSLLVVGNALRLGRAARGRAAGRSLDEKSDAALPAWQAS